MDEHVQASKLEEAFDFINQNASPTSSYLIGTRVLDLKLRDRRHMRRAVRQLLTLDHRFQEVHAGLWETLDHEYGAEAVDEAEFRVLDLEVTGSDPHKNAIIDLAVFGVRGGRVRPLLSTLVDPKIPIPLTIQRLTGIDASMVQGAPHFEDVLEPLLEALEGGVFVAHNASFDYNFLKTWIERVTGKRFTQPHLCTVKLSHLLLDPNTKSRKLHNLARQFGIPLQNRHRAHDDAHATALILVELLKGLPERNIHTMAELKLYESGLVENPPSARTGTDDAVPGSS
jgi:DNA polymerase III epsilon subunit family exonuclease